MVDTTKYEHILELYDHMEIVIHKSKDAMNAFLAEVTEEEFEGMVDEFGPSYEAGVDELLDLVKQLPRKLK